MSADETYNGWSNYETWVVNLWLDNDEGSQRMVADLAAEALAADPEYPVVALADRLQDLHEDENPLGDDATVWSDLLAYALAAVDWREIAAAALADMDES